MGKWESHSDFQGSAAASFSTAPLATTIYAFRMAGWEVTLYGRFWVTPEADATAAVGEIHASYAKCTIDWTLHFTFA